MARMMLVLLAVVATPWAVANGSDIGTAACDNIDSRPCRIVWDMRPTPRAEYQLERYDIAAGGWEFVEQLSPIHLGVTGGAVDQGFLYRVRGCASFADEVNCIHSSVYWVSVYAENMDELPASVPIWVGDHELQVSKHESLFAANMDYNAGLLAQIFRSIEDVTMPPMTAPSVIIPADGDWPTGPVVLTKDLFMQNELYFLWERVRASR